MNRKQLYNEITSLGLQKEVKSRYGKNYTQCSNEDLQKLVDEIHKVMDEISNLKGISVEQVVYNRLIALVEILAKKKILLKSEVDTIMNA